MNADTALLVVGNEEFLRARTITRFLDDLRSHHGELIIHAVSADDLDRHQVLELLGPSLFGGFPVLRVTDGNRLDKHTLAALVEVVSEPDSAFIVEIVKSTDAGAKAVTTTLQKAGTNVETVAPPKNAGDRRTFAQRELRRAGIRADADAINTLIDGEPDLRGIAMRADQLADDHRTGTGAVPVTAEHVANIVTGKTVTGFVVADALIARNPTNIAHATRAALNAGAAPLFIQAACMTALRDIAHLQAGNTHKMPPWKAQKMRPAAHRWNPATLARAINEMGIVGESVRSSVKSENDLVAALLRAVA